jgi:transcriptional regulator with XRE-family HTH domain
LYDLRTIAYWLLEREAHSRSFCANLHHITPVVISLTRRRGSCALDILKAEGRSLGPLHEEQQYEIINDDLHFIDVSRRQLHRIGERMRTARLAKRISQAELARLLKVTGSTISQAENGLISLSLQHLINFARAVDLNPAAFFDESAHPLNAGLVLRKDARVKMFPSGMPLQGLKIFAMRPDTAETHLNVYEVQFEQDAKLTEHFLSTKATEFGLVLSGKLQLQAGKGKHELAEGDCAFLEDESPTGWRNIDYSASRLLWVCCGKQ